MLLREKAAPRCFIGSGAAGGEQLSRPRFSRFSFLAFLVRCLPSLSSRHACEVEGGCSWHSSWDSSCSDSRLSMTKPSQGQKRLSMCGSFSLQTELLPCMLAVCSMSVARERGRAVRAGGAPRPGRREGGARAAGRRASPRVLTLRYMSALCWFSGAPTRVSCGVWCLGVSGGLSSVHGMLVGRLKEVQLIPNTPRVQLRTFSPQCARPALPAPWTQPSPLSARLQPSTLRPPTGPRQVRRTRIKWGSTRSSDRMDAVGGSSLVADHARGTRGMRTRANGYLPTTPCWRL